MLVSCPHCSTSLDIAPEHFGQSVQCRRRRRRSSWKSSATTTATGYSSGSSARAGTATSTPPRRSSSTSRASTSATSAARRSPSPTVPRTHARLRLEIKPDARNGGTSEEELADPNNRLNKAMMSVAMNRQAVLMFRVHPDSFNTYLLARPHGTMVIETHRPSRQKPAERSGSRPLRSPLER